LSDEGKRKQYDTFGMSGGPSASPGAGQYGQQTSYQYQSQMDPEELFRFYHTKKQKTIREHRAFVFLDFIFKEQFLVMHSRVDEAVVDLNQYLITQIFMKTKNDTILHRFLAIAA
jgi:hypothetical protein